MRFAEPHQRCSRVGEFLFQVQAKECKMGPIQDVGRKMWNATCGMQDANTRAMQNPSHCFACFRERARNIRSQGRVSGSKPTRGETLKSLISGCLHFVFEFAHLGMACFHLCFFRAKAAFRLWRDLTGVPGVNFDNDCRAGLK